MKSLIVTADDFGMSKSVNAAVERGWNEGILTSASLMVTGEAAADAAATAKRCKGLHTGLHLVLLQGKSAGIYNNFPSLTDREGFFPNDPVMGGMRLFFIKPLIKQIRHEIKAQIEKFLSFGLPLTHIDGHLNIHLHPTVFDIILEIIPEYGIKSLRLTRELHEPSVSIGEMLDTYIFRMLSRRAAPHLDQMKIRYSEVVRGIIHSGRMIEENLTKKILSLNDGLTEIYLHPAIDDDEILAKWRPGYSNRCEFEAITSASVKEIIRQSKITLCNYNGEIKNV